MRGLCSEPSSGCGAVVTAEVLSEMLILVLVAAAGMRLCPLVGAQPLCRARTVRTGKVFNVMQAVDGDVLYFPSTTPRVIKHPCRKNVAVYLGRQLFFTTDSFKSSLPPLTIPSSKQVGVPAVTSVHFIGSLLLLVVNQKVYIYNYREVSWKSSVGINHPVSHISGDNCCFTSNVFCIDINNRIFAYLLGEPVSQAHIYESTNGGRRFTKYTYEGQAQLVGSLGGIFNLYGLSQIGMLIIYRNKGTFKYSHHPLDRSLGLAFNYNETLNVAIVPGHRGLLILWSENSLLFSHNSGQLVDSIPVKLGDQILYRSLSQANATIHTIAFNEYELAVLTKEDHLYYGSMGLLSGSLIKFADQPIWSQDAAMMFLNSGMLEIVTPLPDPASSAFDFKKCLLNIQELLMDPELEVDNCKLEYLDGDFVQALYTIDMHSKLEFSATLVTGQGTSPIPLDIYLKQQQHWGRTDPNFTSSLRRATISTLTVDIANKEMSCIDIKPLSTLISIGCNLDKKIIVQNKVSACSMGILDSMVLQDNYNYIVEKEFYDLSFQGNKSTKNQVVHYPYDRLGCPRLVYHDTPWRPVIELWQDGHFEEVVKADYVLREVNGLFTYSYTLSVKQAGCYYQPQNWTTIIKEMGEPTWDRENYVSCFDDENTVPLQWPEIPYQILGGRTENSIVFGPRNGIYIFFLAIVDPYYSYCHLQTMFSIYVHGAYPPLSVNPGFTMVMLMGGIMLALWLAYVIPKLLSSNQGQRIKMFGARLCWRCKRLCRCHWLRSPKLAPK
ncbi:cation channel sperm-associated auxiliary subunit delta isoform X2 [Microcebus murinus]|uniref:cation channel sperm-associated auxiliary subunit delta isoform X2 n=1 Tax=Microcebus murinus TaxID=30608 RepID=UPI003F6AC8D7